MNGEELIRKLDATRLTWTMRSIPGPGRNNRYQVRVEGSRNPQRDYRSRIGSLIGEGATFEEAAEAALKKVGLLNQKAA